MIDLLRCERCGCLIRWEDETIFGELPFHKWCFDMWWIEEGHQEYFDKMEDEGPKFVCPWCDQDIWPKEEASYSDKVFHEQCLEYYLEDERLL